MKTLPTPTQEDLRQLARVRRGESVSRPGAFLKAIRAEVIRRTRPEEAQLAQTFLARSGGADVVTVQVAVEPDAETAKNIIQRVTTEPDTMVRVRVERDLLGGLRLFHRGALHDASWRSRIRNIFTRFPQSRT